MSKPTGKEGYIPVTGGHVWYRRVGNDGIPLLTLHGGPGAGHDYLEPFEKLAIDRPVIFYDQLGCGKSDQPDDLSLWRIERFVTEITTVRQALGLERIHLLGHSWGGWLAIEYMLSGQPGVESLVLASTSSSTHEFVSEARRLLSKLPGGIYGIIQQYEATGDYDHPEYQAAVETFFKHYFCRAEPWPELLTGGPGPEETQVYQTMNGPNEFTVVGNLKDWDRTNILSEISVPTLITVGRFDEVTPACAATLRQGIPNSHMVVFEESAHMAHLEETETYLQVVADFLAGVESHE